MPSLNSQPRSPVDEWWADFALRPVEALESFLLGEVYLGRLERNDPDEILYRLFHRAGKASLQALDAAFCAFFEKYFQASPPDFSPSHWAEILENAFSAVVRLDLQQTRLYLRDHLDSARAWLWGLYQGPARDPEAQLLRTLALSQPDRTLLPLWMRLSRLEEDRPLLHASLGLLGLQKLPDDQGQPLGDLEPAIFRALVDLAAAIHQQVPDKKRGAEFWRLALRALMARYPRTEAYWVEHFLPLLARTPDSVSARWLGAFFPKLKTSLQQQGARQPTGAGLSQPPSQGKFETIRDSLKKQPLAGLRSRVQDFLQAHERYARHTGDAEILVKVFNEISRLIMRADPAWARNIMTEALLWAPYNMHNWMGLARIELIAGRPAEAVSILWQAKRRFPENEHVRTFLAQLLSRQGEMEVAEILLRQTKEEFPQNEVCRSLLAQVLMKQDKFPEAELVLKEAMEKFPQDEVYRTILAQVLMKQDRFPEAEPILTETVQKFPQDEVCRTILAQVLMQQDKFTEAEQVVKQAMGKFPQNEFYPTLLNKIIAKEKVAISPEDSGYLIDYPELISGPLVEKPFIFEKDEFNEIGNLREAKHEPSKPVVMESKNGNELEKYLGLASAYRLMARRAAPQDRPQFYRKAAGACEKALLSHPHNIDALLEKGFWLLDQEPPTAEAFFQEQVSLRMRPNILGFQLGYLQARHRQGKAMPFTKWAELKGKDEFAHRRTLIILENALQELSNPNGNTLKVLKGLRKRIQANLDSVPSPLRNNENWVRSSIANRLFASVSPEAELAEDSLPIIYENYRKSGLTLQGILEQSLTTS